MQTTKRMKKILEDMGTENLQKASINDLFKILQKNATAKFDERIDCAIRLTPPKKKSSIAARGLIVFPHSCNKKQPKIGVFAKSEEHINLAKKMNVHKVGLETLVADIEANIIDCDYYIATPDVLTSLTKISKILGPKGLMPNAKLGTITNDIETICSTIYQGKQYKEDKSHIIHCSMGYASFETEKLVENFFALLKEIYGKNRDRRPLKDFFKSIYISSTMGTSIKINISTIFDNIR